MEKYCSVNENKNKVVYENVIVKLNVELNVTLQPNVNNVNMNVTYGKLNVTYGKLNVTYGKLNVNDVKLNVNNVQRNLTDVNLIVNVNLNNNVKFI